MNALFVFLGGGVGSLIRYGLSLLFQKTSLAQYPIATLSSNVFASLLVGVFTAMAFKMKFMDQSAFTAFFIIGICGGFSTFSTFSKENVDLLGQGRYLMVFLNVFISVSLCILAVYLGKKWG